MPGRTLPTFTQADLAAHKSKGSCYVTIGNKVYDITEFLPDHPGGEDFILDHAGKEIGKILEDEVSHKHSEAAYEILDEYLIGHLVEKGDIEKKKGLNGTATSGENGSTDGSNGAAKIYKTGMSREEDLSIETDIANDYKTHKFIDLGKPMFMQIWRSNWSKDFYLEQVHRPRYYRGGDSAQFFGNFLEPLSKAPWYVVPTLWLPAISYALYKAHEGIQDIKFMTILFLIGLCAWTLLEYTLHRCLFHLDQYVYLKTHVV